MKHIAEIEGQTYIIEIIDEHHVRIDGELHEISFEAVRQPLTFSLLVDGKSFETNIYRENGQWEVLMRGHRYTVDVVDEREQRLRSAAGKTQLRHEKVYLQAPMPGLVIDIPVQEGQDVEEGDVLLVLESMKMQNELTAPRPGTVSRIKVKVRDNVDRKQTLIIVD
ncbi:MAG: biotin/lipoyl-containing protein [Anaerolineales bacterium]